MLKGLMMALMECYECGGKVSYNADSCPHCGSKKFWDDPNPTPHPTKPPIKWKDRSKTERQVALFVLCVIGILAVAVVIQNI
jgi:hypothetical protein